MNSITTFRTLRDLGAAAWFGGALMGATGLNAAADAVPENREVVITAGWDRWTPVFRVAAVAHLLGSVGVLAKQRTGNSVLGLGLTGSAVVAMTGTLVLGARDDSTKVVHALEWVIPALLGGVVAVGARHRS